MTPKRLYRVTSMGTAYYVLAANIIDGIEVWRQLKAGEKAEPDGIDVLSKDGVLEQAVGEQEVPLQ